MLTVLGLAGFGGYRRRAPAQRDGLADFGGYRRQAAGRHVSPTSAPQQRVEKEVVLSMVLCDFFRNGASPASASIDAYGALLNLLKVQHYYNSRVRKSGYMNQPSKNTS
jgi:hypothetical protein